MDGSEVVVLIKVDADIVTARQEGRALAGQIGFSGSDQVLIATAISEAARNILQYARSGEIILDHVKNGEKEGILIIARDQGPGIPADVLPRIFIPFFTTKPQGTGLGLALVQRIVNDHGGTVRVESGGQGTVFTLSFPARNRVQTAVSPH